MTAHTPTTGQVRRFWQYASNAWLAGYADDNDVGPDGESHGARFDRWLTAHDRKIAAEAWDAAVKAMRYEDGTPVELVSVVNPYRADRIERGGE